MVTTESGAAVALRSVAGVAHRTTHEYVRDVLRRAVLNGELAGGTRLVQAEIASSLNVSTTPVREALRDLAAEGLIDFDPHRGAIVQEKTPDELVEIYSIRRVLEPLAMRQAAGNMTKQQLEELRALHDGMVSEPRPDAWVDHNREFHMSMYEPADSPRLLAIIGSLEDASIMTVGASLNSVPGLREKAIRDHDRILTALENDDLDGAVAAIEEHLTLSMRAMNIDFPE